MVAGSNPARGASRFLSGADTWVTQRTEDMGDNLRAVRVVDWLQGHLLPGRHAAENRGEPSLKAFDLVESGGLLGSMWKRLCSIKQLGKQIDVGRVRPLGRAFAHPLFRFVATGT